MMAEQAKAEAKRHFVKDLADEQAGARLEKQAGELPDEDLEAVAGGPYIPAFPFVKELKEKIVEESPK